MAHPLPASREKELSAEVARVIERDELEPASAEEILTWAIKNFHPRLALSASFGAPDGMALLHMMHAIEPASRVVVIDTGRLPQQTYDLIDRVRDRFDKKVEVLFPDAADVGEMVREHGPNLFYESIEKRRQCCRIRKVDPLRRYLSELDAYVTGLRRDQNANRSSTRKVEIDRANGGVVKINPIADWSHERVMAYVHEHDVPLNRLHAQGYPSVGCAPCTRAVKPGEDARAGRWWWEEDGTKECGLHLQIEEGGSGI
ncbi:MAG: phosphoadenylyl-sulfate reductase [Myxococcota bacterium]|nr:phosphoadenylyl-sulfate reductase [Myxococcales bacterium]